MRRNYRISLLILSLAIIGVFSFVFKRFWLQASYLYIIVILFAGLSEGIFVANFIALLSSFLSFLELIFSKGFKEYQFALMNFPLEIMTYFIVAIVSGYFNKKRVEVIEHLDIGNDQDLRSTFYALDVLEQEIEKLRNYGGQLTIAILDLDNFKKINRKLGYTQGDLLLRLFGKFLLRNIRPSDIATRYAGDEFLVIFPNTSGAMANEILDNLKNKMRQHKELLKIEGINNPFSFCAGIVEYCPDYRTVREFFRAADDALFMAKAKGSDSAVIIDKNRTCTFRNRRYWERIGVPDDAELSLVFYDRNAKAYKVKIGNISMAGVMFYVPVDLKEGSVCELEFIFPEGEKLIVDGKTIWKKKISDKLYQVGVFISHLSPKQKFLFYRNLRKMKQKAQDEL